MTARKHHSGHHKLTEEDGDPRMPGRENWRRKLEWTVSGAAGRSWRYVSESEYGLTYHSAHNTSGHVCKAGNRTLCII